MATPANTLVGGLPPAAAFQPLREPARQAELQGQSIVIVNLDAWEVEREPILRRGCRSICAVGALCAVGMGVFTYFVVPQSELKTTTMRIYWVAALTFAANARRHA